MQKLILCKVKWGKIKSNFLGEGLHKPIKTPPNDSLYPPKSVFADSVQARHMPEHNQLPEH